MSPILPRAPRPTLPYPILHPMCSVAKLSTALFADPSESIVLDDAVLENGIKVSVSSDSTLDDVKKIVKRGWEEHRDGNPNPNGDSNRSPNTQPCADRNANPPLASPLLPCLTQSALCNFHRLAPRTTRNATRHIQSIWSTVRPTCAARARLLASTRILKFNPQSLIATLATLATLVTPLTRCAAPLTCLRYTIRRLLLDRPQRQNARRTAEAAVACCSGPPPRALAVDGLLRLAARRAQRRRGR